LSASGLSHQQRRSPSTASRIITPLDHPAERTHTPIPVVGLADRFVERLVVDVIEPSSSHRPRLDGARESPGQEPSDELPAVLASDSAAEGAVLPLQKAARVDHHGHEELPLPLREAEAARAFTRPSVMLSYAQLPGYSCVTGIPP
jgi:hypothetical protein